MASEVEICNLALAHLGDAATVASLSPPEGSAQAEHCARFYPIARDTLLEAHSWKFATRRETLALLDVDTFNWSYAYAEPNNALRILSILPMQAVVGEEAQPFETMAGEDGSALIYTDLDSASAVYTTVVTDTTKFSPLFIDALSRLLASYLAGPVIKGDAGKAEAKAQFQAFRIALASAVQSDANQRNVRPTHSVGWMTGR